jgi:predicted permease
MRGSLLDFVHAWRLLLKSPGFTFLAVLCLALGIGVNTSIFSLLNFLYLRPLPVQAPDRLLVLSRGDSPLISYPDYRDLRDRSQSLEGMAVSNPTESSLDFDGQSHAAAAEAVSLSYPRVIGVRPYLGRWFEREDEQTAVISFRTWQRLFHGDPNILGKRVRSETQWYTIVGVAPREFAGIYLPLNMDLWVPFQTWARQYPDRVAELEDRTRPQVFVFGRLKPGIEMSQATAELNAIAAQMQKERPRSEVKPMPLVAERVRGVPNIHSRKAAAPLSVVLMAVVGMVLLIACVNVGNLLLARGAAREREISTRIALGAGRARILRQLLTESLLLAAGGGLLGFILGAWTSRWFETILPTTAFGESLRLDLAPDLRVAIFSAALALLTTLLFGLAPAWRASRTDVIRRLKGDAPTARFRLRRISLAGQVSVSLVLLLTAGLFLRVLLAFQASDPGFAVNNRLYVTAYVSAPEFTPETGRQFYARNPRSPAGTAGREKRRHHGPAPLDADPPGLRIRIRPGRHPRHYQRDRPRLSADDAHPAACRARFRRRRPAGRSARRHRQRGAGPPLVAGSHAHRQTRTARLPRNQFLRGSWRRARHPLRIARRTTPAACLPARFPRTTAASRPSWWKRPPAPGRCWRLCARQSHPCPRGIRASGFMASRH